MYIDRMEKRDAAEEVKGDMQWFNEKQDAKDRVRETRLIYSGDL